MKYRIRLDLAFSDEAAARDILDKALDHIQDSLTLNPGTPYQEQGYIRLEECYHDEDPVSSCVLLEHYRTPPL